MRWRARRAGPAVFGLLLAGASFAVTLYAGVRLLAGDTVGVLLWFVGAAVLHDLVLLPLYAGADRALQRLLPARRPVGPQARTGAPWVNYVRFPVVVSGVLLLVWFPLVLGQVQRYEGYTTLPAGGFWERWLLITAGLFTASAALLALRLLRARKRNLADTDG